MQGALIPPTQKKSCSTSDHAAEKTPKSLNSLIPTTNWTQSDTQVPSNWLQEKNELRNRFQYLQRLHVDEELSENPEAKDANGPTPREFTPARALTEAAISPGPPAPWIRPW